MKIQDAIQRLSYTISKGHKPNESDKIALNKVIHDLNANAKETVNEHYLFAKLYAIVLNDFANHYGSIEFAGKQLNKELDTPLGVHLEMLRLTLTDITILDYFKSKGVYDPLLKNQNFEKYKHLFPQISGAEFLEVAETWDTDNTTAHFTNAVNQSILCFKKSL